MHAIVLREFGGPENLDYVEVDVPPLGPGESLVRVGACSVEPGLDIRTRTDGGGWPVRLPHVLGASFAGTVVASEGPNPPEAGLRALAAPMMCCGDCRYCRSGHENSCVDKRFLGIHRWGGYADFAVVPTRNLIPLGDDTSFEQAASASTSYGAAWHMVVTRGAVRSGDTILVLGASGAVGIAAAQIAQMYGAKLIIGGRNRAKLEQVAKDVEPHALVDTSGPFVDEVMDLSDGGVDLVVDTVGAATWRQSIDVLRAEGRIVCCGASSGWAVEMELRRLYRRNLSLLFSSGGTFGELQDICRLVDSRHLRPTVHAVYPLSRAADAHRDLKAQQHVGKLVLRPDGAEPDG